METKFLPNQEVWLIYANKVTNVKVNEVRLTTYGVEYYFWHKDFPTKDLNLCTDNLFKISEDKLFESKEELIKSL